MNRKESYYEEIPTTCICNRISSMANSIFIFDATHMGNHTLLLKLFYILAYTLRNIGFPDK